MANLPRFYAEIASSQAVEYRQEAALALIDYFEAHEDKSLDDDTAYSIIDETAEILFRDTPEWEVIDRTRKPLSRVVCRTSRADATMIVEALNFAVDLIATGQRIEASERAISPAESIANL